MKAFRRFALISTVATYILIFIGGLVRVSGAGLGCPDWPKCFGRWIPPTGVSQLPADMDPGRFNFALAWIEYFNRLVGVTVGLLILITAILALVNFRHVKRILLPSLAALVLVAYQGWQGGQVVSSQLEPLFVSLHMVLALIIASILIYVTQQSFYLEYPASEKDAVYPAKTGFWIHLLWIGGILQVLLGTQVRSAFEVLRARFPLAPVSSLAASIGAVHYIHAVLGLIIAAFTWYAGIMILKQGRNISGLVRESAISMLILITAQILLGFVLLLAGLPSIMQLFHLWMASLYIGILFLLYSAFKRGLGDTHAA